MEYPGHLLGVEGLKLCRDLVGILTWRPLWHLSMQWWKLDPGWTRIIWMHLVPKVNRTQVFLVEMLHKLHRWHARMLYFDLRPNPKILFQGDTPEVSDTFQWPVIERDRVGGLRLMIWDKVKVPLCHYSDAPEESKLWTAWQLFPLDDG